MKIKFDNDTKIPLTWFKNSPKIIQAIKKSGALVRAHSFAGQPLKSSDHLEYLSATSMPSS